MSEFLIDTDVLIDVSKGNTNWKIKKRAILM